MPSQTTGHSLPETSTRLRSGDGFATRAIRAGQDPCTSTGSTIVPIYQTATFTQDGIEVHHGFDYSRTGNPTRLALERQLAELEGGRFGAAFASGMAAIAGACAPLRCGDHLLATSDCYGGTYRLFVDILTRWGIEVGFVDTTDLAAVRAALRPNTKMLWIETPTNPLLRVADLRALATLKRPGLLLAVDNTFLSPYFQRPLELGADIVVHSTTKYVNGHSDVVGGVAIVNDPELFETIAYHQNAVGAIPGPQDAYLALRGAKTLALRMRRHEENAFAVARMLEAREDIAAVFYPGLPSHPDHALAKRQQSGFGGIVSFRVRGGPERAAEFATRTRLFNLAVSLGGVESLLCIPAAMTHKTVPPERKLELGITDDLIRLSVGLEEPEDLVADLASALDATITVGATAAA
ncbi:MAG: trans-sulfuration enzyme family protein [Vulcanimicrobiaceae bacterium]